MKNDRLIAFLAAVGLIGILAGIVFGLYSVASAQTTNFWTLAGTVLRPSQTNWTLTIPSLGGSGTRCLQVSNTGAVSVAAGACGSGSGGGGLATTTPWTAGQVPMVVDDATVQGVSTTTLTASAPLALSQAVVKIGGSNSVLSLDTSGTWTGNAGTATALAADGSNCSAGNFPLGVSALGAAQNCTDAWTEAENTAAAYLDAAGVNALINASTTIPNLLCSDGEVVKASSGDWVCAADNVGSGGAGLSTSTPIAAGDVIIGTSASTVGADAGITYSAAADRLTVTNASTTAFSSGYASSTNTTAGILNVSTSLTLGGDTILDFVGDGLDLSGGNLIFDCSDVAGTGLSCSGEDLVSTLGTSVDLTSEVTGTLPYGNGGTGTTTAPVGQVIYAGATAYQSAPTSTPAIGSVLSYSGTLGNLIGGSSGTFGINNGVITAAMLANADFGNFTVSGGVATIDNGSVTNAMLANSTISGISLGGTLANLSATDSTLTFSGTYTGATARTIGINLGNPNTWTGAQTFGNTSATNATTTGAHYTGAHHDTDFFEFTVNYSTTTQGVGTTTKPATRTMQWAGTLVSTTCYYNQHMRFLVQDTAGNRMNDFVASSTSGTVTFTTNNSFTAGETLVFYTGTTTASLGTVYGNCTFKARYD